MLLLTSNETHESIESCWSSPKSSPSSSKSPSSHAQVLQYQKIAITQNPTKFLNLNLILNVFVTSMTWTSNIMSTPLLSQYLWHLQFTRLWRLIKTMYQLPCSDIPSGSAHCDLRQKFPALDYCHQVGTDSHWKVHNKQPTRQSLQD